MNTKKILGGVLLILGIIIPSLLQKSYAQSRVRQGIAGEVIWKEGNHMPGIGTRSGITKKISREIVVYPVINEKDTKQTDGSFYSDIKVKKIASVKSRRNGKYAIRLPQGKYSVFVLEKGKLYANRFDGDGNINPIEVKRDKITTVDLIVDYKAAH